MHHITAGMILTIVVGLVVWLIVDLVDAGLKIKIARLKERSRNNFPKR